MLHNVKQYATIYLLVRNARLHFVFEFDDLIINHDGSPWFPSKPLVKWYHGSLQNCKHQFDSHRVCHRHSNDMCGSSECEVGQVSEAFAVL